MTKSRFIGGMAELSDLRNSPVNMDSNGLHHVAPLVTVIIPTKDREEILESTLSRALEAFAGLQVEVIIVNDSKHQVSITGLTNPIVRVIPNNGRGVAAARNSGVAKAKSKWVWLIDDDIWLNRAVVERMISIVRSDKREVYNFNWIYPEDLLNGIIQKPFGRFLNCYGFTAMKGWCRGVPWVDNDVFPAHGIAGATLLIPRDVYVSVNGYDSSFPLAGFEDHDFSVRVLKSGVPCFIDTTVTAHHNEVNKTVLKGFLKRTFDNAMTRAHAVKIGYKELQLNYPFWLKALYTAFGLIVPSLFILLENWPNLKILDPLYFVICKRMMGYYIFKGYSYGLES